MDTIEKRIRDRAYYLWEAEGRPHGRDREHWERACLLHGLECGDAAERVPPSAAAKQEPRATAPSKVKAAEPVRAKERPRQPEQPSKAKAKGRSAPAKKAPPAAAKPKSRDSSAMA